jgi:hypothetical protein
VFLESFHERDRFRQYFDSSNQQHRFMSKSYLMAASTRAADADAAGGHSAPAAVRFEGDADGALARAYECDGQSKAMEMKYPMHCMKMSDFLQLTMLEAHNGLVERGLVVPLNFDGKHAGVEIQFVSHQWLGYTVADPNGDHLKTMQAAFRIAIDEGKGLFKSHEDWKAYAEGMTTTNATSFRKFGSNAESASLGTGSSACEAGASPEMDVERRLALRHETFKANVADSWVWMDFLSVPQTVGLSDVAAVQEAISKQADAIRSIPSYIRHATTFWICTPQGAKHESGELCSYATWSARGWCRLEETTIALLNLATHARPIMLTDPVGARPLAVTPDSVDRMSVHVQRRNSVLTGAFSCCRLKHQVQTLNGNFAPIPCDKIILRKVLAEVYVEGLSIARDLWQRDKEHDTRDIEGMGTFWSSMMAGITGQDPSFALWYFHRSLRQAYFAEGVDEPDFVALGWSKPFEELTAEDCEHYCARWGMKWRPDHSVEKAAGCYWPAQVIAC